MHPNHTPIPLPIPIPMVPLDPKTGSTLEEKKPLDDGRQPPPSNPNNNPKPTLDNSDKVSNYTKQKRQKHDYFYSFILMNLLYEDMHDTTYVAEQV